LSQQATKNPVICALPDRNIDNLRRHFPSGKHLPGEPLPELRFMNQ
jgi:hypothetical protein